MKKFTFLKRTIFILLFFSISSIFGQTMPGDPCPGANCTSQDIQDVSYFVGDINGNPLSTSCTPGDPVVAYIYAVFNVNATNRYDINVYGDLFIDGVYDSTFNECLGDYGSAGNPHSVQITSITYTCGETLSVNNTVFSWNVNNSPGGTCTICNTPKCKKLPPIVVDAPLVANFSTTFNCVPGNAFEQFTFTGTATGGDTPYSYTWNFGFGASPGTAVGPGPHIVSYNSTGVRTVTVIVTDSDVPANSDSHSNVIDVQSCCVTPSAPVSGGDQTECEENPIQTLTATATVPAGQTITWYDAATGGNVVANPIWNQLGSITYWAEATVTIGGCSSLTRTAVTLTINPAADAPISTGDITECEEDPIQTLDANDAITPIAGQSVVWYDAATGGNVVANPILNTVGTVTYWAEGVVDQTNCSSLTRTAVTLTINPAADAPISTGDITECEEDPIQTLDANDAITPI
ncbi:hypothetical protein KXJ69_12150, partial [Aureisphaera sp. CAU 1614]